MKKFVVLVLLLFVGFSLHANGNKERVLLFVRHGRSFDFEFTLQQETGVMIKMLEEAGFTVDVATGSGEPIEGLSGQSLKPDLKLSDVRVEDYAGVIMPCMATGSLTWHADPDEITLASKAVAKGSPVAAQYGAIIILAEAGVLKDRKCSYISDLSYRLADAKYAGTGVIRDGNIITSSNSPFYARMTGVDDGTPELTRLFIEAVRAQSSD